MELGLLGVLWFGLPAKADDVCKFTVVPDSNTSTQMEPFAESKGKYVLSTIICVEDQMWKVPTKLTVNITPIFGLIKKTCVCRLKICHVQVEPCVWPNVGSSPFPQTGDGIAHRYVRWRWGVVSGWRDFMRGLGFERWMKNTEFFPGFFRWIEGSMGIWGIGFTVWCLGDKTKLLSRMFRVSLGSLPSLTRNHIIFECVCI